MLRGIAVAGLGLSLVAAGSAEAQSGVASRIIELRPEVIDLVPRTIDLVFRVETLEGAAAGLTPRVENLQVTETETEIRIELSGDVLFGFDSEEIRAEAEPVLTNVADVLKQHPSAAVTITGYTDAKGSDSYNLALSERRAASVREWLVGKGGVRDVGLETRGRGEADPVAPNQNADGSDNPEGRQKNRRVEISVRK